MEVHFTPETEAQLKQLAASKGKDAAQVVEETVARARSYAAAGVDALFLVGVETREQLEAVAGAVELPLMIGRMTRALNDIDYLSAKRVRVALQGHLPFMAAIRAIHDVLKSLREGQPPREIAGVAPEEMVKRLTRDEDYRRWLRDFLGN